MKKWILIAAALLSLIIFVVFDKNDQDLGGNYYYLPKYEAYDIGFPEGAVIYKGNQKYNFDDIKISDEVIDVSSDDSFISAVQKADNTLNYYLIVKKTDSVYGPFTLEEYQNTHKKLAVSHDLIDPAGASL